jgi:hypothetical protein
LERNDVQLFTWLKKNACGHATIARKCCGESAAGTLSKSQNPNQ